jgi:hypothetical protein
VWRRVDEVERQHRGFVEAMESMFTRLQAELHAMDEPPVN